MLLYLFKPSGSQNRTVRDAGKRDCTQIDVNPHNLLCILHSEEG